MKKDYLLICTHEAILTIDLELVFNVGFVLWQSLVLHVFTSIYIKVWH